ncbi:MAG: DUF4296 domain-containing protein [Phocaeicola sp.]
MVSFIMITSILIVSLLTTSKQYRRVGQLAILSILFFTACSKTAKKPEGFIDPEKMEEVLYDYHLGLSMSTSLPYTENYKKESYRNYIFAKHDVTPAEFDSSMVWYTRHAKELTEIYKNLTERFKGQRTNLQDLIALRDNTFKGSLVGDTVDIWKGIRLHWLTDYPLTNKILFEIKTDSNFQIKDEFLWEADIFFFEPDSQQVVVGLNIHLANDSVIGKTERFTSSSRLSLFLKADTDSAIAIKELNGFIYYSDSAAHNLGVFVNNISLTRFHDLTDTTTVAPKNPMPIQDAVELTQSQKDSLKEVERRAADVAYPTETLAPALDAPQLMNSDKIKSR